MSIKLAICTPSAGFVRVEFAESLARLQRSLQIDNNCKVTDQKFFYICGSVIPYNRQWCVDQAMQWGATHVLFLDDDMAFRPEVVKQLLKSHKLPIVAANCVKRVYPLTFMALDFAGQEVKSDDAATGIEEVMLAGNSVILIRMEVFRKVPKPWFAFPYIPAEDNFETEDYFFQRRAREAGFGTFVDHDASKGVVHIGAHNFSYNDAFHLQKASK